MKLKSMLLVASLTLAASFKALAADMPLPESKAIRAILGEAGGTGFKGMLAVACALRHRGTFHGVYGLNNPVVDRQPAWAWKLARRAWLASRKQDTVAGANFWGNKDDVKKGTFLGMTFTVAVGGNYFFRG
jgi:hypothetical protein